jgi:hypothetical protein
MLVLKKQSFPFQFQFLSFVPLPFLCICLFLNYFHAQLEKEEANRLLKRRLETERPRVETTSDMSEDLFEGEKGEDAGDPSVAYGDSTTGNTPRISSVDKLYIVLIRYTVVSLISSYCILLSQCAV